MWLNAKVQELVEDLRNSYWFVPALLALAGFSAGLLLVYVDVVAGTAWMGQFEWLYGSRPAGARSLLSTVAGSTITVAGVVFSITLAAVTYASGQYGPRLLTNFIRDRGNQVTLGIFIGTFLYCLVVLRTIRSAEEASADTAGAVREAFVPHLAVFGGMALAIMSIAVLIYFVHHVTDGIHINNVIARIGHRLLVDIKNGHDDTEACLAVATSPVPVSGQAVTGTQTGYVESLDEDALLAFATERSLTLTVLTIPGDFVHRGQAVLLAEPGGSEDIQVCSDLFVIGRKRSPLQDLRFAIDELVELAARALSPGVNDPFTAIACIDWLGAALTDLAAANPRPNALLDGEGRARIVMRRLRFADYLDLAVGQLRPYAARDPNVAAHMLQMLERLCEGAAEEGHRVLIAEQHQRLGTAFEQHHPPNSVR